jgi:hypothetical protein
LTKRRSRKHSPGKERLKELRTEEEEGGGGRRKTGGVGSR